MANEVETKAKKTTATTNELPKKKKVIRRVVRKVKAKSKRPRMEPIILFKLVLFTVLMFSLPFMTYYLCMDHVFYGNYIYSALAAAFVANLVVAGYVLVAVFEDDDEEPAKPVTEKKSE